MGDKNVLSNVVKACTLEERDNYMAMVDKPFVVIKAAGSFGIDMVAIRGDLALPIEVKCSKHPKIGFSGDPRLKEQADRMRLDCEKANLLPIYAFRLKGVRGEHWRLFKMEVKGIKGHMRLIEKRLPSIPRSKFGNRILDWNEGLPLNEFLAYVNR